MYITKHPKRLLRVSTVFVLLAGTVLSSIVLTTDPYPVAQARTSSPSSNIYFIDNPAFYVRQHYLDFLTREPDAAGQQFWTNEITSCGSNAVCLEIKKINVSAAFFLSIEFQETGYLVYRLYKAAFGNIATKPVPVTRSEFMPDTDTVGQGVQVGIGTWQQKLEANKVAYVNDFVVRTRFTALYPSSMTAAQYVDTLNTNSSGALNQTERNTLVNGLLSGQISRAQVLRAVAEDSTLRDQEFRKAFVLLQYFGYLKRDPDAAPDNNFNGYNFWLNKLNQFNGDFVKAEMVKAFIVSGEYRDRFAQPQLTAFNNSGDPQLLRAVTARGDVVDYFGTKNTSGLATKLDSIQVKNKNNQVTKIKLDSQSRPSEIQSFNGVSFKITWSSSTSILLTALSADGTVQVNMPLNLSSPSNGPIAEQCNLCNQQMLDDLATNAKNDSVNRQPRSGKPVQLTITNPVLTDGDVTPNQATGTSLSTVNVKMCGSPVNNATVGITVIPSSDPQKAYNVPANFSGAGQYVASIPVQPSAGQGAENLCKDLAGALGTGCTALQLIPPGYELRICALIAARVTLLNPVAGAAVLAACEVGFVASRLYCETLGASPDNSVPSILETICGGISEVVDRFAVGNVLLVPVVFIPGEGVVNSGSGKTVLGTGPFPTFDVDAGGQVEIVSFTTSPSDPAPFQDYLAEALIKCAPPNTQVTISISGSDGYSDSATATITGEANVTLTVPGAEQGVVDLVTVTVSNGPTRRILLAF